MFETSANNKRIAQNTVLLYIRTLVILLVSLYTSRVVLNALGVEDYGTYNIVGGFVTMFSLLSGALSNAISRFITFELGRGDLGRLKDVFSTSVTVQIILAVITVTLAELLGLWFLNVKMNIPDNRMVAANWVFQCSLLTFAINLVSIPYNACIIAHEHMNAFAYISILEALLKLCAVFLLFVIGFDKLIVYAVLLAFVATLIRIIYGVYCSRNFEECHYTFDVNKPLIKEMTSLAGWNMLGSSGSILNSHGVNLLMNMFFGVTVNAARGLAVQVNSAVTQFVNSFTTAVNPQITKSYAQGDKDYLFKLVMMSSKYSFFLTLVLAAPIIAETPYILKLWLKQVPDYTVLFVRLTMIVSLIASLSTSLYTLALSTGNIKKYQIVVGSLSLSCFFVTYVFYELGLPVETAYYVNIGIQITILFARLIILSRQTGISIRQYIASVLYQSLVVALLLYASVFLFLKLMPQETFVNALLVVLSCEVIACVLIFLLGLNKNERKFIVSLISKNK